MATIIPGRVEPHIENPDAPVPARSGHHRHLRSRSVLHHDRVGGYRLLIGEAGVAVVAQQIVAAAGYDHIHPGQARHDFDLLRNVLEVADQDDHIHPLRLQTFHFGFDSGQHRIDGHVAGTRDVGQHRGHGADHADPPVPFLDDRATGDQSLIDQRLQLGLRREVQVGRQEGDRGLEALDEPGRHLRPHVEVVVAQRHRVVDPAQGNRVVKGAFARQGHSELLGSQEVVTRSERHHRLTRRASLQQPHQSHESSHTGIRTVVREELRLAIVVVQDREDEGIAPFRILGAGCDRN